ncbi:DUF4280 domain-containing protein [Aquimarina sp. I32.4]|uniref:DUF4280 domain-containing protein n=1 Tax=Aquimarina sp. I32.4 TaxID=2053903 RepID=UPI0018EB78E1|nr:DUF4280 domain-containing protein [Aquimarina sp. I32.4]
MSRGHVVVDGAMCKCMHGNAPDTLVVQSQQKAYINDGDASRKLVGNSMDLGMPLQAKTFGQCKLQPSSSGYLPCIPNILRWQNYYNKVELSNGGQILTEESKATCAIAGAACIEFTFHGQTVGGESSVQEADPETQVHLNPLVDATMINEEQEEINGGNYNEELQDEKLKFKAYFHRLPDYKGEFGFDWMRFEYIPDNNGETICEDFEKLKKEYTPFKIGGEDYFVPWISMFPKQEGVQLNLRTCIYNHTEVTDDDIIKLPPQKGIRFEPDVIKVSKANMDDEVLVTIYCDDPLTDNVTIKLKDKDNTTVGKLHFFKNSNHKDLHFEITPVRIVRKQAKEDDKKAIERKIDLGFGDIDKNLEGDLQNLQEYLNTQSLNQALLQCTIGKVYDIEIDEQKWIKHKLINDMGCMFMGNLLEDFNKVFEEQHPKAFKRRGITIYISPLNHIRKDGEKGAGAYGNLRDIDAKSLVVFKSNLWSKTTFAHEIAHVAGLEHSFKEEDNIYKDPVILDEDNVYIKEVDDYINYMLKNNYSKKEIADFWNDRKEGYKTIRSLLNVYYRNLHKFKQGKTENFMDYYNTRKSFWKFQWIALQDDIVKFYKSK